MIRRLEGVKPFNNMPIWLQVIALVLLASCACYYSLKKEHFFDVRCPNCRRPNKVRWTQRDGIKYMTRVYYFICSSCGEKVAIKDKNLFQGQLPMFVVTEKSELTEGGEGNQHLPVIVGDEQGK